MAQTMSEKILARTSGRDETNAGEFVTARADRLMCHEAMGLCMVNLWRIGLQKLPDPDRIVVVLDHYFPAPTERMARAHTMIRKLVKDQGIKNFLGHDGICHQVLTEQGYVSPGNLIFGTDSHSTTYGAVGAAGSGIGLTEMSYALATGELWMQVPPTIRFELVGKAGPGIMSKDVILYIAGKFGTEVAQYKAIEFGGPVAAAMSIASRMTVANMGIELGAKFALFEADQKAVDYLEGRTSEPAEKFGPDPGASYEAVHEIDISALEPQVACPHNPGNVKPVSEVIGKKVDQVFLGSCTNARLEDFEVAAEILKGRKVHDDTRLIVTPASQRVYIDATAAGYTQILLEAGAHITASGCGACPGGHNGLTGPGEVCLSSTNRNFRGRMGSPDSEVYLASPATVAAGAVAGEIVDPREYWTDTTIG